VDRSQERFETDTCHRVHRMTASETFSELDLVALVKPVPAHNLPVGQTGTIVFVHGAGEAFEVEFPITPRESVVATIAPDQIIKLKGLTVAPAV